MKSEANSLGNTGFPNRWVRWMFVSSALLLLITALAKLVSSMSGTGIAYLDQPDPLFSAFSIRNTLPFVALIEFLVAGTILNPHSLFETKLFALSWFTCALVAYRAALFALAIDAPCACLGGAADWLGLSSPSTRILVKSIIGFFAVTVIVGSVSAIRISGGLFIKTGTVIQRGWILLVLAGMTTQLSAVGRQNVVRADGVMDVSAYNHSGGVFTNFSLGMRVQTDFNGRWYLKLNYTPSEFSEYGSDGTNVYSVLRTFFDGTRTLPTVMPGTIVPGVYPHMGTSYERVAWLSLLSRGGIDEENILPVWLDSFTEPAAHVFDIKVGWSDSFPYTLKTAEWRVSKEKKNRALSDSNLVFRINEQSIKDLDFFRVGFVGAAFHVNRWTNLGGFSLPADCVLVQYAVPDGTVFMSYNITFTSFSVKEQATQFTGLPDLNDTKLSIVDYRLRDSEVGLDYLQYQSTNSTWPVSVGSDLRLLFEQQRKKAERLYRKPLISKQMAIILFALFIGGPIVWRVFRSKKS